MHEVAIPRAHAPSANEFRSRFQVPAVPVVLTGMMEGWPASERWSPASFRERYGDRRVPVIPTRDGAAVFSPKSGVAYTRMRIDEFVDSVAAGDRSNYMVFRVEQELPSLLDDVRPPRFWAQALWRRCRFWFAPPDIGGPLHRDLPDNLYAQVSGRKRWTLLDRRESRNVYSYPPWSGTPNYSKASGERPDYARFPRLRQLTRWTAELSPGEMLYIPRRWWHEARSLDVSISMNFWWAERATLWLVRAAEAFMRVRGLRL
jgi:lysine-specific demethylase 8